MTTQPDRQPERPEAGPPAEEPERYEGMGLTGEQARLVRFILIVVAASMLFAALAFFVVLS